MEQHLEALRRRHHEIDDAVQRELTRPAPNSMTIRALKKARLKLKDDIAALMCAGNMQRAHLAPQPCA